MDASVTPIIEAQDVHKSYYLGEMEVQALHGVSLRIDPGEMVAVMGPSGCGKTTLLNCLSGLDNFDSGRVCIDGQMLTRLTDRKRTAYRAHHMGFIFQTFNLLPVISAQENVELPLLINGVSARQAREQAREVLAQVGLAGRTAHRPTQLSGGQRQRVAIARALVNRPAIVWADEPTGNLDEETSVEILELMRQLNRKWEQTFVVVTHDTLVSARCDRVIRMQQGQIKSASAGDALPDARPRAGSRDPETVAAD